MTHLWRRFQLAIFHCAANYSLWRFDRRLRQAIVVNEQTLRALLSRNCNTNFGRDHNFKKLIRTGNLVHSFAQQVPLSSYEAYEPLIARISKGEANVLTADRVHMLAGSSGTTSQPKRIPRTRHAQAHHLSLVVLAEQAVINRGIAGARQPRRGINLMSFWSPPLSDNDTIPVMAGPNAGMERIRRHIPLLWCAPIPAYAVADPSAGFYLHALFALHDASALYIETPFAPQVVNWFMLMEQYKVDLVHSLRHGTLPHHLNLTTAERNALTPYLIPDPIRAMAVELEFSRGFQNIVPRLWPNLRYIQTITSGSFELSLPRLKWLAGPNIPVQSGCYSSSEGIIGINLKTDGSTDYVLAVGTAFFEFIPLCKAEENQPSTVSLDNLVVGEDYEVVLTSRAGLYRYRLGDIVRITGRFKTAPTFQYLYRRGTLLNLVGEKTTEFHTCTALTSVCQRWLGSASAIKDYTVAGDISAGVGRYTFYLELNKDVTPPETAPSIAAAWLDKALGDANPYYRTSGREPQRLAALELKLVKPGTFDALLALQLRRSAPATATQIKTPRLVIVPPQLTLLEANVVTPPGIAAHISTAPILT